MTDDLSDPDDASPCRVWPEDGVSPRKSDYYGNAEFLRAVAIARSRSTRLLVLTLLYWPERDHCWARNCLRLELKEDNRWRSSPRRPRRRGQRQPGCWFSSLTLLAASVAALLVYTVRRHRTDDYQGRYRVWLWAAGCWFLMATDQAASLREGFRNVMVGWTGTPLFRDGTLWWVVVYVLVFGAVGSRLLLDMRPSRLSIAALTAATIAYGLAPAGHLGWTPIGTAAGEIMFRTRQRNGRPPDALGCDGPFRPDTLCSMRKGSCRTPTAESEKTEGRGRCDNNEVKVISAGSNRWRAIDPPHVTPQPTYQRPSPQPAAASVARSAPTPCLQLLPPSTAS